MKLLMVSEVAKVLRVSKGDVYKLIKNGHIQALKLGSLKVPEEELERFIDNSLGKEFIDFDQVKELGGEAYDG